LVKKADSYLQVSPSYPVLSPK